MTLTQFNDALATAMATTPGVYVVRASLSGTLRIVHNHWTYCPITFVAHAHGHPRHSIGMFEDSGRLLHIRKADRKRLVESTDHAARTDAAAAFSFKTRLALLKIMAPYIQEDR